MSEGVTYRLWSWDLKMCLLERCPHVRGCYVQAMELGPEDVSIREVSSCQRVLRTGYGVGT